MIISCPNCGNELEIPDGLVAGQHLVCPYCNQKFSYHSEDGSKAFCTRCGNALSGDDAFCSKCGAATGCFNDPSKPNGRQDEFFERIERIERDRYERELNKSDKSRVAYIFLGLFLGFLGVHNLYIGKFKRGLSQLIVSIFIGMVTGGFAILAVAIWAVIDICTITKDAGGKNLS